MEYKVVFVTSRGPIVDRSIEKSSKELEEKVNALLKEGWKPQGGIHITSGFCFLQAMVK